MMLKLKNIFFKNTVSKMASSWAILFILFSLIYTMIDGQNPAARYTLMQAMSENHSFEITKYDNWTIDYSETPDGKRFSNKAPGPSFIAFPMYFIFSKFNKIPGPSVRRFISLVYQVIPWAVICLLMLQILSEQFAVKKEILISYGSLALLWGNTASILMNVYFGHGMAAFFVFLTVYYIWNKNFFLVGLSSGFLLLSEYSAAVFFIPVIYYLFVDSEENLIFLKRIKDFVIGGIVPGILWIWYHVACFGSPFKTAVHFQRKMFLDQVNKPNFLGVFSLEARPDVAYELFFGEKRGLLVTQPWILVVLCLTIYLLLFKRNTLEKKVKHFAIFTLISFALAFLVNLQFGEWHGGGSPGPRYIAYILPLFGILALMIYASVNKTFQTLLWIGLIVAIAFRILIAHSTILSPTLNIWTWSIWHGENELKSHFPFKVKYFITSCLFLISFYLITFKKLKFLKDKEHEI